MAASPLARQVVALGLALAAVALSLAYPLRGYVQQRAAERASIVEQQHLEQQIQDLQAQVEALQDPAYVRAEAKRRLQYVSPGDTVYVVKLPPGLAAQPEIASPLDAGAVRPTAVPAGSAAASPPPDGAAPTPDPPWYESLWGTLTGDSAVATGDDEAAGPDR